MNIYKKIICICICISFFLMGMSSIVFAEEENIPLENAPSYNEILLRNVMPSINMITSDRDGAINDLTISLKNELELSPEQNVNYGRPLIDDVVFSIENEVYGESIQDSVLEEIYKFENTLSVDQMKIWNAAKEEIRNKVNQQKIIDSNMVKNNDIVIHTEIEEKLYMKQNNITPTTLFKPSFDENTASAKAIIPAKAK